MTPDDDNDIARLFAQFGGDPGTYQEIATVAAAREARARWPVLSTFDPLASIAAPAVGADDASVIAQAERTEAERSAESAHDHDAGAEKPRAAFMPPRPKPFSREIPDTFLVPIAAEPVQAPVVRTEPAIAPAVGPDPEPAVPATAGGPPAPAASSDPFRRLAASHDAPAGSPRLPDLFDRLLSS